MTKVYILGQPEDGISCMEPEPYKERFQKKVGRDYAHYYIIHYVILYYYKYIILLYVFLLLLLLALLLF
jgi:hypothetical protein